MMPAKPSVSLKVKVLTHNYHATALHDPRYAQSPVSCWLITSSILANKLQRRFLPLTWGWYKCLSPGLIYTLLFEDFRLLPRRLPVFVKIILATPVMTSIELNAQGSQGEEGESSLNSGLWAEG